jgi:hypothetical protein
MSAKIQTLIVVCMFMLLYVFIASMGGISNLFPLIFLPPVLFLLARRDLLFMLLCFLFHSTILIPMMTGQLELYHLAVALYILSGLGSYAVRKRSIQLTFPVLSAIGFAVVVIATMKFRGTGFRLLGSGLWGGGRYVEILLGLGLFVVADTIRLPLRRWRIALVGMVATGALPALAELLFVFTKGASGWIYLILQPFGRVAASMQRVQSEQMVRFTMMLQLTHIYLIPFLTSRAIRFRLRQFLFPVLAMVLGGFSGHRMVMITVVLYVWMYRFVLSKNRLVYVLFSTMIASSLLFALGQVAFLFPANLQRMLSMIPLARIASDVHISASSTITWRLLLWKESLPLIPDYLWLGKGFAYSVELAAARDVRLWANYALWWAKVQSAYHQGILSLLIGLGLPGLLTGSTFLISLCARHYRLWRDQRLDPEFAPIHYAVLVLLLVETMIYFVIYGDVFVSFPSLCLIGSIAEGIYRSGRIEIKQAAHTGDSSTH